MKTSNQAMHPLFGIDPADAIGMLIADHKQVATLFASFQRLHDEKGSEREKARIVGAICEALIVHTQLEEELFYPAVRAAIGEDDPIDEAFVEHASAKQLIADLQGADPAMDLYDAKVTVLGEQVNHHVEEEEGSLFPKARYAGVDLGGLGAAMLKRRGELRGKAPEVPPVTPAAASRTGGAPPVRKRQVRPSPLPLPPPPLVAKKKAKGVGKSKANGKAMASRPTQAPARVGSRARPKAKTLAKAKRRRSGF